MTDENLPHVHPGQRIGLLGGSFNPAHEGHLHISLLALELLRLDVAWWLVSPQNPLKPADGMAPLDERMASATKVSARHPINVTDVETRMGTQFTADTLAALKKRHADVHMVWLMGADNLVQIDKWSRWREIFETVPVAVFARPDYSEQAEEAKASRHFARFRVDSERADELVEMSPPAWAFFRTPENPVSATEIRARTEGSTA